MFSAENITLLTQLANMVMREVERKRAMNDALCSAALRHNRWACLGSGLMGCGAAVSVFLEPESHRAHIDSTVGCAGLSSVNCTGLKLPLECSRGAGASLQGSHPCAY